MSDLSLGTRSNSGFKNLTQKFISFTLFPRTDRKMNSDLYTSCKTKIEVMNDATLYIAYVSSSIYKSSTSGVCHI